MESLPHFFVRLSSSTLTLPTCPNYFRFLLLSSYLSTFRFYLSISFLIIISFHSSIRFHLNSISLIMSSSSSQPHRRSTRPSPIRKQPRMIAQPGDSRRSVHRDEDSETDGSVSTVTTKQKKRRRPDTDNDEGSDASSTRPTKARTKTQTSRATRKKAKPSSKRSRNAKEPEIIASSRNTDSVVKLHINLTQDSDEENEKVSSKKKANKKDSSDDPDDDSRYDRIKDYFDEPYHGDKDVSVFIACSSLSSLITSFFSLLI